MSSEEPTSESYHEETPVEVVEVVEVTEAVVEEAPAAKPTFAEQEAVIEAQGNNKNFLIAGIAIVGVAVLGLVAYWVISAM